ncbi:hypothetical protein Axy09_038 [Achromobacter phage vB_AxyP_19-32_Axy09]|uniref:Uncharacterized protein n=1 Tax=Achromobacter phage vB_AxyP_19-32_Axy09 TaxID=2591040 RepID=A0A514CTS6_9CAUD|nr:hypothetical protein Axy09_038 [Achromobacter phage vB_AxyP_19-32_Axy09]
MVWWFAVAAVASSAAKGFTDGKQGQIDSMSAANQRNAGYLDQMRQRTVQLEDLTASNEAGLEANIKNALSASVRASLINVQVAQRARQQANSDAQTQSDGMTALGAATANAAASGTIGASVDAVNRDIERSIDRSRWELREAFQTDVFNAQTAMNDLFENLDRSMYTPQVGRGNATSFDWLDVNSVAKNAPKRGALAGLISGGGQYAMSTYSLGLGNQSTTSPMGGYGQAALGGSSSAGMGGSLGSFLGR